MERHILQEGDGMLQAVAKDYPRDIISPDVVKILNDADPTTDKKYLNWMVKQNIQTSTPHAANHRIAAAVREFDRFKDHMQVSDINFYYDLEHLEEVLADFKNHMSRKDRIKHGISAGKLIYEDITYQIFKVHHAAEVCTIGHDTGWCHSKKPGAFWHHVIYIVVNKMLRFPDINKVRDLSDYNYRKEAAMRWKKVLVAVSEKFRGTASEADLDDYTLMDMQGNIHDLAVKDVTNDTVEEKIFEDFAENGETIKELDLEITPDQIEEWCNKHQLGEENRKILLERYERMTRPIVEGSYKSPALDVGDRVELIYMKDNRRSPKGTKGTVLAVETTPWGIQYRMRWDDGGKLSLIPDVDMFKKV